MQILLMNTKKNRTFKWVFSLLALVKIILVTKLPQGLVESPHDGGLFLRLSSNILAGNWLGDYSNMTLIKGCFYPLFMAFNAILGLPLIFTEQLLYCIACFALISSIKDRFNIVILVIMSLVLLGNPMSLPFQPFWRDEIYLPLIVFATAFSIRLIRGDKRKKYYGILLGITLSFLYLTREEYPCLLPYFILIIYFFVKELRAAIRLRSIHYNRIFVTLYPFIAFLGINLTICSINYYKYKIFITSEYKEPNFLNAYSDLNRIVSDDRYKRVPISRSTMRSLYNIIPSLKKIEPQLEERLTAWSVFGDEPRDQVKGGWFVWAFRDAVQMAGFHKDAQTARKFYRDVHKEILQAEKEKKLKLTPRVFSLLPPFTTEDIKRITARIASSFHFVSAHEGYNLNTFTTSNDPKIIRDYMLIAKPTVLHPSPDLNSKGTISGWFYIPQTSGLVYRVYNDSKEDMTQSVAINLPRPDVRKYFDIKDSLIGMSGFIIKTYGRVSVLSIIDPAHADTVQINILANTIISNGFNRPAFYNIDQHDYIDTDAFYSEHYVKLANSLREGFFKVDSIYGSVFAKLNYLILFLFFALLVYSIFRRQHNEFFIVSGFIYSIIFCRIALFSAMDVLSYNAIVTLYLGPVYPLLLINIFLVPLGFIGFKPLQNKIVPDRSLKTS
jgi:hypothetical protein